MILVQPNREGLPCSLQESRETNMIGWMHLENQQVMYPQGGYGRGLSLEKQKPRMSLFSGPMKQNRAVRCLCRQLGPRLQATLSKQFASRDPDTTGP